MKPGKEYEQFIFKKLKDFFHIDNFEITLNDKILGELSKIRREIDISIKGKIGTQDILYIVQCKDHKAKADIKIIGEFSAVLRDVGASKGYLICSSGFTKTINHFAKASGIELVTIQDVESNKWKADVEIPTIYIKKTGRYDLHLELKTTKPLSVRSEDLQMVSVDNGKTLIPLVSYLNQRLESEGLDTESNLIIDFSHPNLSIEIAGTLVDASSLKIGFSHTKQYFLKYIKPKEYSHLIDHIEKNETPFSFLVEFKDFTLDESFTEVDPNILPVSPKLSYIVEEKLTPINQLNLNL